MTQARVDSTPLVQKETGPVERASLWQLLTQDRYSEPSDLVVLQFRASVAATSKYLNMRELATRKEVRLTAVDPQTVFLGTACEQRLKAWREGLPAGMRERVVRWEIMKAQMTWGVVFDGVVVDAGIGRVLRIPLHSAIVPTTKASIELRLAAFNNPVVVAVLDELWQEILGVSGDGGVPVALYFAGWREIATTLLVHLNDREVHQLVTMEAEFDYADRVDKPLNRMQFLRGVTTLGLIWLETHSTAEALQFTVQIAKMWRRVLAGPDLSFLQAFTRKNPSSLVVSVPPRVMEADDALITFAQARLVASIKLRFEDHHYGGGTIEAQRPLKTKRVIYNPLTSSVFLTPQQEAPRREYAPPTPTSGVSALEGMESDPAAVPAPKAEPRRSTAFSTFSSAPTSKSGPSSGGAVTRSTSAAASMEVWSLAKGKKERAPPYASHAALARLLDFNLAPALASHQSQSQALSAPPMLPPLGQFRRPGAASTPPPFR